MNDNVDTIEKLLQAYPDIQQDLSLSCRNAADILAKLTKYIETHKWLLNEKVPFEITLEQAFFSWYENVYRPIWSAIDVISARWAFPNKDTVEIFDMISTAMYFAEEKKERTTLVQIVKKLIIEQSPLFWRRVWARWALNRS